MSELGHRLKLLLPSRRRAAEREMREELDSLAALAGRRELGNLTLAAEDAREEWSWGWLERLGQDLGYALRTMRKNRGITALCILSIALGIGLTAGMFSVEDAMFLRPLPIDRPAQMYRVNSRGADGRLILYGWLDCQDMSRAGGALWDTVAYERRGAVLTWRGDTQIVSTHAVTPNYFAVLGVRAALGGTSLSEVSGRPAVVLGDRIWKQLFGGDVRIVGKSITVGGQAFSVAGVMPPEFTGLVRGVVNDLWVSTDAWFDVLGHREERPWRKGQFEIVVRLKPGANPLVVAAQLDAAIRGEGKHAPPPAPANGSWLDRFTPDWKAELFLAGGSFVILMLILFIACANVAQLRLAQAESQNKELSLRVALGAAPWRIVRLRLFESGLMAIAGGAIGILIARGAMAKATEFLTSASPFLDPGIRLDMRVLAFAGVAALLAVLLTGLAPARQALKRDAAEVLKSEQGSSGRRTTWGKRALLVGQVGVSVAFFGIAVLSVTSLQRASAIRPGMDPQKKLFILSVVHGARMPLLSWAEQACERLAALPGVRGVTFARRMPLSGSGGGASVQVELPGQTPFGVHYNNVGGNYFAMLGTRILAGRGIGPDDRATTPPVVVVSRTFAHQVFGDGNPLDHWIVASGKPRQIVGVAEDAPSNSVHETPEPFLYFPFAQMPSGDITLIVETAGEPAALAQAIRRELKRFDSLAMIFTAQTLREQMDFALLEDRMMANVSAVLGAFGVLLAAAGMFGVLQYGVARRTRELGVRIALGANPRRIQRLVFRESLLIAAFGAPLGLLLLAGLGGAIHSITSGMAPLDPIFYIMSAIAAVAIAVVSGWLPARRATQVDPLAALRTE